MFPIQRHGRLPYVIGHRGAKGHAPENTMASFKKAAELGADLIECDVHFSRDKQIVVIHDEAIDRTTDGFGLVRELSLPELKWADAGQGEKIPTLDEVLNWLLMQPQLGIAIEIKKDLSTYPGLSEAVLDRLQARNLVDRAIVTSFDYAAVHEAKDLCPDLATGILMAQKVHDPLQVARDVHADALWPALYLLNERWVDEIKHAGLGVVTWTANSITQIEFALAFGVDGVGSDYPDVLRHHVDRMAA